MITDAKKQTIEAWNKVAALYQEKFMHLAIYNETYDFFCAALAKEASVLDLGCGPGNITKYLLTKLPSLSITGIDVASNMVALAKKNNPTAVFFLK